MRFIYKVNKKVRVSKLIRGKSERVDEKFVEVRRVFSVHCLQALKGG